MYKDLYGKPLNQDWVAKVVGIQILLIFGSRCNRFFWDIRLKICRLTNYCNMLFQVLLTKFSKREPFLLITWSSIARQSQPWVSSMNGALITTEYMTFQVFRFLCIVLHVSTSLNRSLPDPDIPLVLHKSSQIHGSMVFHVY